MLGTARLLGQTLGTTLVALLFRMFAEGHRAQACLLLAIFFAIAAGVVSSIRMTQASPAGRNKAPKLLNRNISFLIKTFSLFLSLRAKKKRMNLSIFGENLKQSKPDEYMKRHCSYFYPSF